jgi:transposase
MLGDRGGQEPLFIPGSLRGLIPDDHILKQVAALLDLRWVRDAVKGCYTLNNGRPSVPPECAVRLMLAGFFLGIVHDRKLMREAQVNLAIRWFAGYGLDQSLPEHSSLTRLRQRWGRSVSARSSCARCGSAWRPGWSPGRRCTSTPLSSARM